MEKRKRKEVKAGDPMPVAGITIIPVAKVSANILSGKHGALIIGSTCLTHIVLVSPAGKLALGMDGENVPLEQLTQEVPGLKERVFPTI